MPKKRTKLHIERGRKGVWYWCRQINGKRKRKCLDTTVRAEAIRRAKMLDQEIDSGRWKPRNAEALTVRVFAKRFLDERISTARNEEGLALVKQRLRDHSLPVLGDVEVTELRRAHLFKLREVLDKKPSLKPQTVKHICSDFRQLVKYANEVEILDREISFRDVLPKVEEAPPNHLSEEELDLILDAALAPQHVFIISFLVMTGLRWSEFLRLTWAELVMDGPDPHFVVRKSKSRKPRKVSLIPAAVDALRSELERRKAEGATPMFVSPIRAKNAGSMVRRIGKRAGVVWNVHQLRHTLGARFTRAGGNKAVLQGMLGHSTIKLTERYSRLRDDIARPEIDRIGEALACRPTSREAQREAK